MTDDEAVETQVRAVQDAQIDGLVERVLTATTLAEALGPLP